MIKVESYEYTRITQRTAKKLFNNGVIIHLLPCKVGFNSMWVKPCDIKKTADTSETFDKHINAYHYYNCNSELGTYISYYTKN